MHRLVYFAYPIDNHTMTDYLITFVEDTKRQVLGGGIGAAVFDPGDAFKVGQDVEPGPEIEQVNRVAQATAGATVAFLPAGASSVGVPVEIGRSVDSGRPTLIFTDNDTSWVLAEFAQGEHVGVFPIGGDGQEAGLSWLAGRPVVAPPGDEEPRDVLPVLPLSGESRLPTRGYHDDAGLDLYVSAACSIEPGSFLDVPCGVAVQLPEWSWGMLTGRSSTLRKKNLLVHTGIIDAGYRGPLFVGVWNMGDQPVVVEEGERLAQLIVMPNLTKALDPVEAGELEEHARGTNGFGSTGV